MSNKVFNPSSEFSANAHVGNMDQFREAYDISVQDRNAFWAEKAERLSWMKKWDSVGDFNFANADIKWFVGGKLNVSYNCLDRHVEAGNGKRTALI